MLGRPIQSLVEGTSDKPASVSFGQDEVYTADCVISVGKSDTGKAAKIQHRGIILLSKRICIAKPEAETAVEGEEPAAENAPSENALFIMPPGKVVDSQLDAPVITMMAGEGSFSAPSGQCEYKRHPDSRA